MAVVMQALERQKQVNFCEFKISLIYKASSGKVIFITKENRFSKKKKSTMPQNPKLNQTTKTINISLYLCNVIVYTAFILEYFK